MGEELTGPRAYAARHGIPTAGLYLDLHERPEGGATIAWWVDGVPRGSLYYSAAQYALLRQHFTAEVDRLRRVEAAARELTTHLPPRGAAMPHAHIILGEYGTALVNNLREALAREEGAGG